MTFGTGDPESGPITFGAVATASPQSFFHFTESVGHAP